MRDRRVDYEIDSDAAGVSPVVGVVLMVAIVVLLSAVVAGMLMGVNIGEEEARAAVEIEQESGAGDTVTIEVTTLAVDNADYIKVDRPAASQYFQNALERDRDIGLMYREEGDRLEWAESSGNGRNLYYTEAPSNDGDLEVDFDFNANSYEGSGAALYAVDADGNQIVIHCDGQAEDEENPDLESKPADFTDIGFTCANEGNNYDWSGTYTVTSPTDAKIERVYLTTDLQNIDHEWYDYVSFAELEVTDPDSGTSTSVCIPCHAQQSATGGIDHDSDGNPNNDIATAGYSITIDHLIEGQRVTVVAVKDGKPTVIDAYTIE